MRRPRLAQIAALLAALRPYALAVALLGGTAYFLDVVDQHYRIRDWLVWQLSLFWLLTLLFNAACLSTGYALLRALLPSGLPLRERALLSMALGVLTFYLGVFVAGVLHLFGAIFFVAWPVIMFAAGALPLGRELRRLVLTVRAVRRLRVFPPSRGRPLTAVILALGTFALGLVYLGVLTPENVAFDARWYHLPIAEHYAARGGIEAFPEGWYMGTLPHLASILYTWAMQWPRTEIIYRALLCAHLEWSLFLWTLFGVSVLVRRVVPGKPLRLAWVAVFLFPGVLVYDGNLSVAADHVAAFWAVPIFLAMLRAWRSLDLRSAVLLGALLAGAMGTKYQASSLVVFPCLAIAVRVIILVIRSPRGTRSRPLLSALAAAGVAIVFWAPHWLANLVWYHDPLYPFMHRLFRSTPWTADSDLRLTLMEKANVWQPHGSLPERLRETLVGVWSFSFEPNDWGRLNNLPVFGSLFTLLVVALPFLRARGRLWTLFAAGNVGIFSWYWLSHQDRYLQALLPWLAAATAAAIVLAWRSGVVPRIAVSVLVIAQVVWGADTPFLHAHRMNAVSQLKVAMDRITSGLDHDLRRRRGAFGEPVDIGAALPPSAKVLVHEEEVHLGLGHASVNDSPSWQGGISYGRFRSPADLDDGLRALGVTHIAMPSGQSKDYDNLAGDIAFFDYVTSFASPPRVFGGWSLFELPAKRPPDNSYGDILWLGCPNMYDKGRYAMSDMLVPFSGELPKSAFPGPRSAVSGVDRGELDAELPLVSAVGFDPVCQALVPTKLADEFALVTQRQRLQVWLRRRSP